MSIGRQMDKKAVVSEWEKIIANEATDKELISKNTSNSCSPIPENK